MNFHNLVEGLHVAHQEEVVPVIVLSIELFLWSEWFFYTLVLPNNGAVMCSYSAPNVA